MEKETKENYSNADLAKLKSDKIMNISPKNLLWEKYYAPRNINELIIPETFRKEYEGGLRNYLLSGVAGTGKTSTAKVLTIGYTVKFIDCSVNNNISMIRDEIANFCKIASIDGNSHKAIILDEIDQLDKKKQQALRGTIEQYESVCRFIATCNYPDTIIDPMLSRFFRMDYNLPDKIDRRSQAEAYIKRIKFICKDNGMTIDKKALFLLLEKHFPDMRKVLQVLQTCHKRGITEITKSELSRVINSNTGRVGNTAMFDEFMNAADNLELYRAFAGHAGNEMSVIMSFQKPFIDYLSSVPEYEQKYGKHFLLLTEFAHKYNNEYRDSTDKFITMMAYLSSIKRTLKKSE